MRIISITGLVGMLSHLVGVALQAHVLPRLWIALLLYCSSLGLFWWALRTTWQSRLLIAFSDDVPTRLVRHGPYRWVRHPIYLAYVLTWLAGAIAIPEWWPWLVVLIMGFQYVAAMRYEERQFQSGTFSMDYSAYVKSTGMIFPSPLKALRSGRAFPREK